MRVVADPVRTTRAFEVRVSAVRSLGPHLRRLTFASEDLRFFGADPHGRTLDLRVKLVIPVPGQPRPDLARIFADSSENWYQTWLSLDPDRRGFLRTYTIRERRLEAGEVDIDFVLHPAGAESGSSGHGSSGPAGEWAASAQVGDPMLILGPNLAAEVCLGIEFAPGTATSLLLVADETAVPAVGAILESLAPTARGTAILEVPEAADFQDLLMPPGVNVYWLARGARPPGELLLARLREVFAPDVGRGPAGSAAVPGRQLTGHLATGYQATGHLEVLWDVPEEAGIEPSVSGPSAMERPYAWVAGEAGLVRGVRRYLLRECGLDRSQAAFMGYWKLGQAQT
ncbi:siderophore-interacting protein [Psychromicrobium xiongbiense]|uniref:siderophore-interacting protein n=1 Tax=Psychromicrobium xiongbiense TaxID=3051184 RepID=UPI0025527A24|nr:siderophore-interacting protein [Psychromicrobium sp. YIM S02556]